MANTTGDKKRTIVKERQAFRKLQAEMYKEAIELIIKRSGVSKKTIIESAYKRFANNNIDLLTPAEMKKYKGVIL